MAVVNGEKKSGNYVYGCGLDTGDMLLKDEVDITEDMTAGNYTISLWIEELIF